MIVTESSVLQLEHFQRLRRPNDHADTGPDDMAGLLSDIVARSTARVERSAIQAALKRHRGNRTETAAALGIGRRTLFNKLRQLRLVEPNEPDDEPA
jgi:DNA-binding NtrC family response regulator